MKIFIFLLSLFCGMETSLAEGNRHQQNVLTTNSILDTNTISDSIQAKIKPNVEDAKHPSNSFKIDTGKVSIIVNPNEANDAMITIIQKSKMEIEPNIVSIYSITPDTLGIYQAPFSRCLSLGNYDIIVSKTGFKDELKKILFNKNQNNVLIEMVSLEYLQVKREQWSKYKWICAAVAVGAGVSSYYFHQKIETYKDEYNSTTSTAIAQEKRDLIARYQGYYRLSSAISFTFIGGFGISWLIQSSY
jgi:hypothetical protein